MLDTQLNYITGIVTYNPDISRLKLCIEKVVQDNHQLLIVDNGSNNIDDIKVLLCEFKTVYLIGNKENYGIAKALNQIFQEAVIHNYEWVLTLDQDTIIPDNLLERYEKAIGEDAENISIICPQIHDDFSDRTWPILEDGEFERYVKRCITSASLNRVAMWHKVGGFDEQLFIDEVDHDYCYRVRHAGGKILLVDDVIIHHTIGNSKAYSIFGKSIIVRNHSAFRKYYIARNILLVDRKQHNKITVQALLHSILFTLKTVIFESDKKNKFKACYRGIRDGIKGL